MINYATPFNLVTLKLITGVWHSVKTDNSIVCLLIPSILFSSPASDFCQTKRVNIFGIPPAALYQSITRSPAGPRTVWVLRDLFCSIWPANLFMPAFQSLSPRSLQVCECEVKLWILAKECILMDLWEFFWTTNCGWGKVNGHPGYRKETLRSVTLQAFDQITWCHMSFHLFGECHFPRNRWPRVSR